MFTTLMFELSMLSALKGCVFNNFQIPFQNNETHLNKINFSN